MFRTYLSTGDIEYYRSFVAGCVEGLLGLSEVCRGGVCVCVRGEGGRGAVVVVEEERDGSPE